MFRIGDHMLVSLIFNIDCKTNEYKKHIQNKYLLLVHKNYLHFSNLVNT